MRIKDWNALIINNSTLCGVVIQHLTLPPSFAQLVPFSGRAIIVNVFGTFLYLVGIKQE